MLLTGLPFPLNNISKEYTEHFIPLSPPMIIPSSACSNHTSLSVGPLNQKVLCGEKLYSSSLKLISKSYSISSLFKLLILTLLSSISKEASPPDAEGIMCLLSLIMWVRKIESSLGFLLSM